jgi:hypothetical protein
MKIARALMVLALGLWALACPAEDIEPLEADFLEYLAALESEDGDWTEVADEPPEAAKCEASAKRDCETEETAQPAAKQR